MTLKERMKQLEAARPQVVAKIASACENATIRAVKKAVELTPPRKMTYGGKTLELEK